MGRSVRRIAPLSPLRSGRCNVLLRRDLGRVTRGLRFRLTAGYALFFSILLIGVAALFRERLQTVQTREVEEILEAQWAAMKGYMRIEKNADTGKYQAYWYFDHDDPDETTIVLDIKKVHLIADQKGHVIPEAKSGQPSVSTTYQDIGIDPPADIQARVAAQLKSKTPITFWTERRDSYGERYQIRGGVVYSEGHTAPYYVAIGMPLGQYGKILREFTWVYIAIIPGALILGSVLGWVMAGRALTPVRAVAQAAQRISGSNLSLRIPTRKADDELDYLILTFNRMIERLEASFQQMKQFSTDVSHELRTPITAIRGQLEVALFTATTTEQYREAIFNALQDIDRLSQIVRALLLLSQAESGQLVLQKTRLNLCEIVGDLVDQFQIPAEEAHVRLTADLPHECPAEVDRVQIERMLTNLLSNAIKFTPRDGEVKVVLRNGPESVELVVEDTGRGIATEYLPHIFDRFYRDPVKGTAPGPDQGLGLGLSFVAWIVRAHEGKIDVASTPGKGTKFTISIPAATEEQPHLLDPQPV
jgi:heavy metal sensor kinase